MTAPPEPPASPPPGPDEQGLLLPDGSTVNADPDTTGNGERPSRSGSSGTPGGSGPPRRAYSPIAVIARVPVRRITKVQAISLVLFTLLSLGPLLALFLLLRSDITTVPVVVTEDQITAEDGLNLSLTVTSVNAVTREMSIRMTVKSSSTGPTGLIEGGRMTETVDIGLPAAPGSLQGDSTVTLEQGSTVGAVEFMVQMTDGSIARYPYDTYLAEMLIIASRAPEPTSPAGATTGTTTTGTATAGTTADPSALPVRIPVPISVEVSADVPGFVVEGELPPDQAVSTRLIDLDVRRNGPTLLYTTWIMFLWWALSVSAVFIVWSVAIWRSSTPPWAYGYLVGVLFALAPLRGALPGQPPYGVLIDYVSFYWAVGTIGVGLILLVSFFVRDARQDGRSRSRSEEQLDDRTEDVAYDDDDRPAGSAPLPIALGTEPVVAPEAVADAETATEAEPAGAGDDPSRPTGGQRPG